MKSRGKSTPYAELLVVVGVLLPISACTWANPWNPWKNGAPPSDSSPADDKKEAKKEMPKVKLTPDEQKVYNRYHTPQGSATGLSDESRSIEKRLGVN